LLIPLSGPVDSKDHPPLRAARLFRALISALLLAAGTMPSRAEGTLAGFGVVLLHGKGSAPGAFIEGLAQALQTAGAIVVMPEMPWSARRIYDATYDQAMLEIDAAVASLRQAGATRIVIAGHSMGANAAIGYAARREGLTAVIALAPGHLPEAWALRLRTRAAIAEAKTLIAQGRGDEVRSFPDLAQGIPFAVHATAKVYLSYFDPDGPAVMPANAAAMRPVPLLWAVGVADPIFLNGRDYAFTPAAKDARSKYLVIPGMHLSTPFQAKGAVVEWLKGL
jgi:dienelactone hydrolase